MNYKEFEKEYSQLYEEEKYQEAVNFIKDAKNKLSKEEYEDYYIYILRDQAILQYVNEDFSGVLETYQTLLDKGYSVPENIMNITDIKNNPKYEELKDKNKELIKKAQDEATLKYKVCLPKDYDENKKYPLFFNVHGDGMDGNIKDQMKNWPPDSQLEQGYIVVYPQSSQTYNTNGHGWMQNKVLSRKEIKTCYDKVCDEYSIDKNHVILAGFSGGADAVCDFTMHQVFPVKGFISLCPTKFIKSFTNDQVINARDKGIKGAILEGEKDLVPEVKELVKEFEKIGFKCEYIVNKNIGHWFPEDLNEKVRKLIHFIND